MWLLLFQSQHLQLCRYKSTQRSNVYVTSTKALTLSVCLPALYSISVCVCVFTCSVCLFSQTVMNTLSVLSDLFQVFSQWADDSLQHSRLLLLTASHDQQSIMMIGDETDCVNRCRVVTHLAVVSVDSRQIDRLVDQVLQDLDSLLGSLLQDLLLLLQTFTDTQT